MPQKQAIDIPAEVKALRLSLGLSQADFAERCNLAQPTISNIESRRWLPSQRTMLGIAEGTGRELILSGRNGKIFAKRRK